MRITCPVSSSFATVSLQFSSGTKKISAALDKMLLLFLLGGWVLSCHQLLLCMCGYGRMFSNSFPKLDVYASEWNISSFDHEPLWTVKCWLLIRFTFLSHNKKDFRCLSDRSESGRNCNMDFFMWTVKGRKLSKICAGFVVMGMHYQQILKQQAP